MHNRTRMRIWLRKAGQHVPTIGGPSGDLWWDDIHPTITRKLAGKHHVRLSTPPDARPSIAYQSGGRLMIAKITT
jgi:hypothetical protein